MAAAAHHRTDAAEQQRSTDHAGCGRRRRSQERAATAAERRLRRAIGLTAIGLATATIGLATIRLTARRLTVRLLTIMSPCLRLLQHLAAVPYRAAAQIGCADVGDRARRLALPEDRVAHRIQEAARLSLSGLVFFRRER